MSITTQRRVRVLAAILGLALVSPALGQDAQNEVAARQEVLAQKFQKEVRDVLKRAADLVKTRPQEALREVRALLSKVESEDDLSVGDRSRLSLRLRAALENLEWQATRRQVRKDEKSVRGAIRHENRNIQRGVRMQVEDEQRRVVNTALAKIQSRQGQLNEQNRLRELRGRRELEARRDVFVSAAGPVADITFPDDWVEKSNKRSSRSKMTATEKAILEALNKPISVEFNKEPLQNVIEYLEKKAKLPITLDKTALMDVGVNEETPVTLNMNGFSTRTVLKRMLGDLNLTYVIKDETVIVTTAQKARTMMTTRTYYIGDLLGYSNFGFVPVNWNTNQAGVAEAITAITQTITQMDPDSWNANNPEAGGTVIYDPISMSLIVRQSAEFHMKHGGGH
jgi:hypothetical protein